MRLRRLRILLESRSFDFRSQISENSATMFGNPRTCPKVHGSYWTSEIISGGRSATDAEMSLIGFPVLSAPRSELVSASSGRRLVSRRLQRNGCIEVHDGDIEQQRNGQLRFCWQCPDRNRRRRWFTPGNDAPTHRETAFPTALSASLEIVEHSRA